MNDTIIGHPGLSVSIHAGVLEGSGSSGRLWATQYFVHTSCMTVHGRPLKGPPARTSRNVSCMIRAYYVHDRMPVRWASWRYAARDAR